MNDRVRASGVRAAGRKEHVMKGLVMRKIEKGTAKANAGMARLRATMGKTYVETEQKTLAAADGGLRKVGRGELGQGTTEYAILVGVLVVIAIVAIIAFKDKLQQLWDAIASGINSL